MALSEMEHMLHGHSHPAVDGHDQYRPASRVLLFEAQAVSDKLPDTVVAAVANGDYDEVAKIPVSELDEQLDDGEIIRAPDCQVGKTG